MSFNLDNDPAYQYSCKLQDRFKAETGKDCLSAWYEYEAWLERQPDVEDYIRILEEEYGRRKG